MILSFRSFGSLGEKKKSSICSSGHGGWKKNQFDDAFLEDILPYPLRVEKGFFQWKVL
jgi:hypothetical protein